MSPSTSGKYRIILIFAGKTDFFDVLSEEMAGDLSYQEMYTEFVNKFVV